MQIKNKPQFVICFITRFMRLFAYGMVSVALMLYLTELGFTAFDASIIFTTTLIGDLVITFYLTTTADLFGRKRTLLIGGMLMVGAGVVFAFSDNIFILIVAGIIGVITPSGGEIGPFLACEQAALTELIANKDDIAKVFGWYNMTAYAAQALGSLVAGVIMDIATTFFNDDKLWSYRIVIIAYAVLGVLMTILYLFLTDEVEASEKARTEASTRSWFGKFGLKHDETRVIIFKLSALFVLDSFAGGFCMQSFVVYYFEQMYKMDTSLLGLLMMAANTLAGISALLATPLVKKIGGINTMVVTHFPSNIFLFLIPLMPDVYSAAAMVLCRYSLSQMDVPARQAYVAVVVAPEERSAAGGITNIVRSIGLSLSPLIAGYLQDPGPDSFLFRLPFIIAGTLKCIYDILLYVSFQCSKKPEPLAAQKATKPLLAEQKDAPAQAPPSPGPGDKSYGAIDLEKGKQTAGYQKLG